MARRVMLVVWLAGLALDQATKYLAVAHLDPHQPISLFGGLLRLQLIRNPGAAFSLGEGSTWLIGCLALLATLVMAAVVAPRVRTVGAGVVAGLATAGITGNLVDRLVRPPGVLRGHVVDFFQLPHFAIFNVADIFITGVAAWLVWDAVRGERRPATPASAGEDPR